MCQRIFLSSQLLPPPPGSPPKGGSGRAFAQVSILGMETSEIYHNAGAVYLSSPGQEIPGVFEI